MTYQFSGIFSTSKLPRPIELPADTIWREVASPFVGIGVRLVAFIGMSPDPDRIESIARELGIGDEDSWLYLTYDCWGGMIDFVYGFGVVHGKRFGPVEDSDAVSVVATYTSLMSELGLSSQDALHFEPFKRGFWDEI